MLFRSLYFGPTISADSLSGKKDHFLRFIATTEEQAKIIAKTANKRGHKRFAVVYDLNNKGFSETLYSNFNNLLEKNGGSLAVVKTFDSSGQQEFETLTRELLKNDIDAVLIIDNSANNAELTQEIRKMNMNIQIYSPLWSNTSDLIKKGGEAVEGMYVVGAIDLNDKTPDFVLFKKEYIEKYGDSPTFASMYSYEAVETIIDAMKNGKMDTESIANFIIDKKNYKGLLNDFQIDEFGDNLREYMIFRIQKGLLLKVE